MFCGVICIHIVHLCAYWSKHKAVVDSPSTSFCSDGDLGRYGRKLCGELCSRRSYKHLWHRLWRVHSGGAFYLIARLEWLCVLLLIDYFFHFTLFFLLFIISHTFMDIAVHNIAVVYESVMHRLEKVAISGDRVNFCTNMELNQRFVALKQMHIIAMF